MNKYLSDKLTILYTILIIMVVYIHSYYLEAQQYSIALFVQRLTGAGICRIANCLFFAISGYLFAWNINSFKESLHKQRRRIRTLLVPYVLWNIIFVLWHVALVYIPGVDRFNNSTGLLNEYFGVSAWKCLYNLFIKPAAFQLWFLRDLLVMQLFSPLLWFLAKKRMVATLVIALCFTVVYTYLLYFLIGVVLGVTKCDIENYPRPKWIVTIGFMVFLGYAVYLACGNESIRLVEIPVNILGLYLVWSLYDVFVKGGCLAGKGLWKYICGYSFFIYCFHEPAFNIIKKLALIICGTNEPVLIFFYFINPWIMIALAIITARLIQHIMPQTYKILTGGR